MAATANLDTSSRLDIVCRKGDTFSLPIDFQTTVNTSGWTMQVRQTDTSEGEDNIILEADDTAIAVSTGTATNSKITVTVAASVMELMPSGLFVYDIQNSSGDPAVVKTYLYGTFKVNEDVTVL